MPRPCLGIVAIGATEKGIVYEGAFGPGMSADSVFWIASMTKAITATACMQLVEQGKLQLEQPMGSLLPQLASPKVLEGFDASGAPKLRPAKRPITLRHLLTHTAGFTYSIWSEPMGRYQKATGTPDVGECKNAALTVPLEFDPGDRWEYGINIDWVGKAVEAVSDQSLEVYFRENIFTPLGMTDTGFLISAAQKARVVPMFSRKADSSLSPMAFEMPQRPEFFMGGGGAFQYATKLHGIPADAAARRHVQRCAGAETRDRRVDASEPHRRSECHHSEDGAARQAPTTPICFPGMPQKWGLSFDINTEPGPAGRSAGSSAGPGCSIPISGLIQLSASPERS